MKRHISTTLSALAACVLLAFLPSCTAKTGVPLGFAEINGAQSFRAISPEGLRYEVYEHANDPKQSLEFWNRAYEYRMEGSGYTAMGEAVTLASGLGETTLHEWVLSWGNVEYAYAHALALKNDRIVIVEIGGTRKDYDNYRTAIVEAIKSLH